MKRDMDLIREVLLEVEKVEGWDDWKQIEFKDRDPEEISYHVMLLAEAGLIEAKKICDGGAWLPMRLTWEGHEFLDAARNDTVWKKTKDIILLPRVYPWEYYKFLYTGEYAHE